MKFGLNAWFVFLCLPGLASAESQSSEDGMAWLQKIASVAHRINYSGTFVYNHGGHMETSRIVHLSDESGEHEKLEVLDGSPREIIRNNDEVVCFMPEHKTVIVEKRKVRKGFPAILPQQLSGIGENYTIKLAGLDRVAGIECQNVMMEPRDSFRYGHRLCADSVSGLLLKTTTLNEKNEMVDQLAFTQVTIGGPIERDQLKSRFASHRHVEKESGRTSPADPGWQVRAPPSGFKKIMAAKRSFPGKKNPANHLVFSDDLVAVSVFIEQLAAGAKPIYGLSRQGAINVYTKSVNNHMVTVVGEVPPVTVMQIADSIGFVAK